MYLRTLLFGRRRVSLCPRLDGAVPRRSVVQCHRARFVAARLSLMMMLTKQSPSLSVIVGCRCLLTAKALIIVHDLQVTRT